MNLNQILNFCIKYIPGVKAFMDENKTSLLEFFKCIGSFNITIILIGFFVFLAIKPDIIFQLIQVLFSNSSL